MKISKILIILATSISIDLTTTLAAKAEYTFPTQRSHCRAFLTAQDSGSRITLRSGPGSNYRSLGYGLVGDNVYILATTSRPELDVESDSQGNNWYQVGFPGSGAKGWIRADFLNMVCQNLEEL